MQSVHACLLHLPCSLFGEQVHQALLQEKKAREDDSERLLSVFESTVRDSSLCLHQALASEQRCSLSWSVSCVIECLLVVALQVSEIEQQQRVLRQEQEASEMELLIAVRELSILRRSPAEPST